MNGNISDINYWILKIIYVLFGMYIIIISYRSIKKNKKVSIFNFYNLYYFIAFCITPFFFLDELKNGTYLRYLKTTEEKYYYIEAFATIFVYFIIKISYKFFLKIKTKEKKYHIDINTTSNRFFIINIFLLIFAWICLILWTYKFGSIFGIFKYASDIRDQRLNIQNPFAFLSKFCVFFALTSYNFIIILTNNIKNKSKNMLLTLICLALSLFGTFIYMINIDSRAYIAIFFIVLMLYFFDKKIFNLKIKTFIKVFAIIFCIILLVSNMNQITDFIKTGEFVKSKRKDNFFVREYGHLYTNGVNLFYMYEKEEYNIKMRFIENIKEIPFAWIPISKKPENISDLNDYNTSFYRNATGELPVDIVTASIYNFGYLGLFINPIIYSAILAIITKKLKNSLNYDNKIGKMIYYYIGVNLVGNFVTFVDIAPILTGYFGFIIFYFLIYIFCGRKSFNEKYKEENIYEKNIVNDMERYI